jgi:hypothetical protein
MNCPTCGAENEADARFCAECGAPLESQASAPVEDDDLTIMSTVSEVSEQAKTVSVTQEDVANLAAEMDQAEEAEFEPENSSPPLTGEVITDNAGGKSNTQRYLIIGVLIFLVLCCCCCVLASIAAAVSNEDIGNLFSYLLFSTVEPFV